jgi:hypothetical protein
MTIHEVKALQNQSLKEGESQVHFHKGKEMYLHTSNTPRRYIYTFPEKEVSNQLQVTATSDTEKGAPSTNGERVVEPHSWHSCLAEKIFSN